MQFLDQVNPVAVGEAEVEDHHVELRRRNLAAGLGQRACLGGHLQVGLTLQQAHHEVPEVGVIVDQHDAG